MSSRSKGRDGFDTITIRRSTSIQQRRRRGGLIRRWVAFIPAKVSCTVIATITTRGQWGKRRFRRRRSLAWMDPRGGCPARLLDAFGVLGPSPCLWQPRIRAHTHVPRAPDRIETRSAGREIGQGGGGVGRGGACESGRGGSKRRGRETRFVAWLVQIAIQYRSRLFLRIPAIPVPLRMGLGLGLGVGVGIGIGTLFEDIMKCWRRLIFSLGSAWVTLVSSPKKQPI